MPLANGFPNLDSPYNADLPYDLEQIAIFAERLDLTLGACYHDHEKSREFHSGGLFANGGNAEDSTQSEGITPRALVSQEVSDALTLNAQACKGYSF